ncbi:type VII secretion protein EccB [Streptomyces sp. PTM05]|uniref:Type VII secretion protein EccB n=1 Tax=Streptantibioticus parmotrematis TaxID=2873249 RepID=A0ABS7R145_9ACTN|nr:type VII secretion protein EccB [Streptantibioticus parmotrematis]MBY8889181.1 type VII secretion protein EccB [Streptantibioticus parmotrematis]
MASRRDELNAYTFARKRTVAAFLQPSPSGSEEGAPRPLRAVAPSLVAAALLVAGFGAWGLIKPGAPQGWAEPYSKVLVGSQSTTRYVVVEAGGKKQLDPVLNLASAKLLLDPSKFGVLKVDESVLDNGEIPHGPTLGIPYAPDRLPGAGDAGTPKLWAVCEQPGGDVTSAQKAAFVLAARDAPKVDGTGRLRGDQTLYVQGPDGTRYLVDASGTRFPIQPGATRGGDPNLLLRALFGDGAVPQKVTADWLETFNSGQPLAFPHPDGFGGPAGVPRLDPRLDHVGMVLSAPSGGGTQSYVVLRGQVARVSALVATLLLNAPGAPAMYPGGTPAPQHVAAQDLTPAATPYLGDTGWPATMPHQADTGSTSTVCSVYRGTMNGSRPALSVWAGTDYPAAVADGGSTAYVTPGSGLLYRQVTGSAGGSGPVFLLTDTGLRYGVQSNDDSDTARSKVTDPSAGSTSDGQQQTDEAQVRLGYGGVQPVPVPRTWSSFLPAGPTLDTNSAAQPQGS